MPKPKFNISSFRNDGEKTNALVNQVDGNHETGKKSVPSMIDRLDMEEVRTPFNLKFIPRSKITMNKKNSYSQDDIEGLAESILQYGLVHNLEGRYDEDTDTYVLESGERRTRALDYLFDVFKGSEDHVDYSLFLENVKGFEIGYPMNIKRKKEWENESDNRLEEINSELRLHAPNLDIRTETPDERLKNIARRKALLEEKNTLLPSNEKISVNKEIAKQEGITERQVQKYNNIIRLIPELQEEFKNNNITLNEGSTYSKLSPEDQRALADLIKSGTKLTSLELKKMQEEVAWGQEKIKEKEALIEALHAEKQLILEEQERRNKEYEEQFSEKEVVLRQELELELSLNNPDKKKIEGLEEKLLEMENASKKLLDAESAKLSKKQEEIKKLQAQINDLKEQNETVLINQPDIEKIKKETKIVATLEQIGSNLDVFISMLNSLEEIESRSYKDDCTKLLDKYKKMIS